MKIGIDPGNTGAIAAIRDDGSLMGVHDMPLKALGVKNQVDPVKLREILDEYRAAFSFHWEDVEVCLEKVHAMPGQGVTSMFNFGMGYGVIQGVVASLGFPMRLVPPQTWKKTHNLLKSDKDDARLLVKEKYPWEDLFERKKDIGRADAVLIALHGLS
jgi:crossover junction endodeoxyribonuclease RuvC